MLFCVLLLFVSEFAVLSCVVPVLCVLVLLFSVVVWVVFRVCSLALVLLCVCCLCGMVCFVVVCVCVLVLLVYI